MISIGALAGGASAAGYYLERRAGCDLAYYTRGGDPSGRWLGGGTRELILQGRVDVLGEEDLRLLLDGRHPTTGERLVPELHRRDGHGRTVDARVAGLDLTFSAPKSVSLLHALADETTAAVVVAAHHHAVGEALAHLERHAGHARRGHHGDGCTGERVGTGGFVAAGFDHGTSRAADPQLHTHVVIANLVHGADGKWSALDTRALYREAKTAGHVYQAVLRGQLTARLGLAWDTPQRGLAEARGVPRTVLRGFSRRRQQIEDHLVARGAEGPAAAQKACLATRAAKTTQPDAALRTEWADRLHQLSGLTPAQLVARLTGQATTPSLGLAERGRVQAGLLSPDALTAHRESFGRRELTQAMCDALPAGADVTAAGIDQLAQTLVADPEVVPLLPAGGERRWTTRELLAIEADALTLATTATRRRRTPLVVDDAQLAGLTEEQARVVTALVTDGRGLQLVTGPAGAGKTAALAAAHAAWARAGLPVIGVAVAARAARGLQDATGIPSTSLARLLHSHRDAAREAPGLPAGTVLVVDEASMVGTRDLRQLLHATDNCGGSLVLLGDPHQLGPIDTGGLFTALTDTLPTLELGTNQRQTEAWERRALAELRRGDVTTALTAYQNHRRIHVAPDGDNAVRAIASEYARLVHGGHDPEQVIAVAATRADTAQLNSAIRRWLKALGRIDRQELSVELPDGDVRRYATGDLVLVTRNDHSRGLLNGDRGRVLATRPDGLTVGFPDRRQVALDRGWLARGHLDHGYALTAHKAQGITVDIALVHATAALDRRATYVALSRGRLANHLHTSQTDLHSVGVPDAGRHPGRATPLEPDGVLAELARQVTRRTPHRLATTQLPNATALRARLLAVAQPPAPPHRSRGLGR